LEAIQTLNTKGAVMYAEPEFVRSGRLGRRYAVKVTVSGNRIDAEWTPALPRKLTRKEMRRTAPRRRIR
jgi:hypothetical protein